MSSHLQADDLYPISVSYTNGIFRKIPVVIVAKRPAAAQGREYSVMSRNDIRQQRIKLWFNRHCERLKRNSEGNEFCARVQQRDAAMQLDKLNSCLGGHQPKWRLGRVATAFAALTIGGVAARDVAVEHIAKPVISLARSSLSR